VRLEIIGPPGAGKGTQARRLAAALGVPHISTGDMFREAVRQGTPAGRAAKSYLERGALLPDAEVAALVDERLEHSDCAAGYLLDGYPRTLPQMESLDRILERRGWRRSAVLALTVPDAEIVKRLAARRACVACGTVTGGGDCCPACQGRLEPRPDDREEVVRERLRIYHRDTEPLLEAYGQRGLLHAVDGLGREDDVLARLREALAGIGVTA
jgi:adenylate kinase